jgi:hypothetical protein
MESHANPMQIPWKPVKSYGIPWNPMDMHMLSRSGPETISVVEEQLKKEEQRQRKRESSLRTRILSRMGHVLKAWPFLLV